MCFLAFKYRDKLGSNVTKHAPALTHIISLFMLQFSFLHLYYLVQLTSLAFIWGRLQFMFSRVFHHRCYITLKYVILLINALKEIYFGGLAATFKWYWHIILDWNPEQTNAL